MEPTITDESVVNRGAQSRRLRYEEPPESGIQNMTLSPARKTAVDILQRVETDKSYAANLLASEMADRLSPVDRRLTYELVLGVLRWQSQLDYLIEQLSGRSVKKLDLAVLLALRIGLYQIRFLSRIPDSASVNESVELVKRSRYKSAAGFVNALLRKSIKDSDDILARLDSDSPDDISIKFSHPRWLIERWTGQSGLAATKELAAANNQPPPVTFRLNQFKSSIEKATQLLAESGIEFVASDLCPGAFRTTHGAAGSLKELADSGVIYFQDEGSQLVASLVNAQPGESILDLCAAPGSKTTALSASMNNGGRIIACDLHSHRLSLLKRTCGVLGVSNINPVVVDAAHRLPFTDEIKFDRVLVDAPCSGTGTLRHNPEIKWRLMPEQMPELGILQSQILSNAAEHVKPGGRLVYSTCSLEREENEDVVTQFLQNHKEFELQQPENLNQTVLTKQGFIRTYPNRHSCDGFFAAVLKKPA